MAKQEHRRFLVLEIQTGFMDGPFGSKATADLAKRHWNKTRPRCAHIVVEAYGVRRISIPNYLALTNVAAEAVG